MTREEAINDLKDFIDTYLTCHGEEDTIAVSLNNVDVEAFHMAIKALEQEPKKGHWIEGQTDNPKIHNILCSCCFEGYPSKGHANSQYTKKKFQYCPNCGAEMESGVCKGCHYNDGEVHAECVVCDKAESEG